jgi:4-diphosphocytidyl-2-C-methyl-D-erythritol kinase
MPVTVRSFAKINLGLYIGASRPDGFYDLRTVYQTIALHDIIRVQVGRGSGIEIRSEDPRVPRDNSNTCYRIAELAMAALGVQGRITIEIEKRLPVQGGLGAGSGNAVATLLALERALKKYLPGPERLRIAAEVGSDLPLFLVGGTVLGAGRGEEVYPLLDLPSACCVVATPEMGVSTPQAFRDWDALMSGCPRETGDREGNNREGHDFSRATTDPQSAAALPAEGSKLTPHSASDRMIGLGRKVSAWLSGQSQHRAGRALSGVPANKGRGRAETPLLDLVRTGIENDFEQVVFPKYPELSEVKGVLQRAGAFYASLSGSGSSIYGLFASRAAGEKAAARLRRSGIPARVTSTLTRRQYWKRISD